MNLTPHENAFIEQLGELERINNALACMEAQAERLINSAYALQAGAAISRECLEKKQQAARDTFFNLLLTLPARRFIKLVEYF